MTIAIAIAITTIAACGSGDQADSWQPVASSTAPATPKTVECTVRPGPFDRNGPIATADVVDPAWSLELTFEKIAPFTRHAPPIKPTPGPVPEFALSVQIKNVSFIDWNDVRVKIADFCAGPDIHVSEDPPARSVLSIASGKTSLQDIATIERPDHWTKNDLSAALKSSFPVWKVEISGTPHDETASVGGFDLDGNGIRDDIDYLIHANALPEQNEDRIRHYFEIATQVAQAHQAGLLATTPEEANAAIAEIYRSKKCLSRVFPVMKKIGERIGSQTWNTASRVQAFDKVRALRTTWDSFYSLEAPQC